MPVIKIPKKYLVGQDTEFVTVDVPISLITIWQRDYEKNSRDRGILAPKRDELLDRLNKLRQEWE